jgi:hypothetical protein
MRRERTRRRLCRLGSVAVGALVMGAASAVLAPAASAAWSCGTAPIPDAASTDGYRTSTRTVAELFRLGLVRRTAATRTGPARERGT